MKRNFKICASLSNIEASKIPALLKEVEMAELRLDRLILTEKGIKKIFSSHNCLIATCRKGVYDDTKTAKIIETSIKAGAAYTDLEDNTNYEMKKDISNIARKNNCKIIFSKHFFTHTPKLTELKNHIDSMFSEGADLVKIASKSNTNSDNQRLLSLYSCYDNLIALGMGIGGTITRIAAPYLGAPFTYASYGENPTAMGQIDYFEMKKIVNLISGD